MFPISRPRRLRRTPALRNLIRETRPTAGQLIWPVFIRPGQGEKRPIKSMPGQFQWSPDTVVDALGEASEAGVRATILFGIPETKDATGSSGSAEGGVVQQSLRAIKKALPDMLLISDVCLCEYTDHGHCGVIAEGEVDNDATLPLLAAAALSHARAGADIVAPSDMMDGRVMAIRDALDETGFDTTPILSYAAKYASSFYGPFRDAAESPPSFGDRRGYQMDPANAEEALREVELDLAEGADLLMVKPGLPYLDVLAAVKATTGMPTGAYHVSGEFAMLKAAAAQGWIDYEGALMESLVAFHRAGADFVLTYGAVEAARLLTAGWEGC